MDCLNKQRNSSLIGKLPELVVLSFCFFCLCYTCHSTFLFFVFAHTQPPLLCRAINTTVPSAVNTPLRVWSSFTHVLRLISPLVIRHMTNPRKCCVKEKIRSKTSQIIYNGASYRTEANHLQSGHSNDKPMPQRITRDRGERFFAYDWLAQPG